MLRRETLAQEIEFLQSLSPDEVPEESRFLLDFNPDDLAEGDISNQEHWILAMQAARVAGMRIRGRKIRWAKSSRRLRRRHDPPTRAFASKSAVEEIQQDLFGDLADPYAKKRPSDASISLLEPSNKRKRRRKKSTED